MRLNPFSRQPTEAERVASIYASTTADLEQYIESLPVVLPEMIDALDDSKAKFRKWQGKADQEATNGR